MLGDRSQIVIEAAFTGGFFLFGRRAVDPLK
jgi:hypothetical protein